MSGTVFHIASLDNKQVWTDLGKRFYSAQYPQRRLPILHMLSDAAGDALLQFDRRCSAYPLVGVRCCKASWKRNQREQHQSVVAARPAPGVQALQVQLLMMPCHPQCVRLDGANADQRHTVREASLHSG